LAQKVKHKGETHLKGKNRFSFVTPLYAPIPKLGDGSLMSKNDFAIKYYLYCEGLSPKCIKVPRDISLEDIDKIFCPILNKNEYNYEFTKDPLFIKKIKTLWMVIHQKPCTPASRLIFLGMVKGLACKKMGK
jgi:hypothetical protein